MTKLDKERCRFCFDTMGDWKGCALTADVYLSAINQCDGSLKEKKKCPIWR
jgi:hypothetical protein